MRTIADDGDDADDDDSATYGRVVCKVVGRFALCIARRGVTKLHDVEYHIRSTEATTLRSQRDAIRLFGSTRTLFGASTHKSIARFSHVTGRRPITQTVHPQTCAICTCVLSKYTV